MQSRSPFLSAVVAASKVQMASNLTSTEFCETILLLSSPIRCVIFFWASGCISSICVTSFSAHLSRKNFLIIPRPSEFLLLGIKQFASFHTELPCEPVKFQHKWIHQQYCKICTLR